MPYGEQSRGQRNILVAIPAYNESATVGTVIAAVKNAAPYAHILVVDDGWVDSTVPSTPSNRCCGAHFTFQRGCVGGAIAHRSPVRWKEDTMRWYKLTQTYQHNPEQIIGLCENLDTADVVVGHGSFRQI